MIGRWNPEHADSFVRDLVRDFCSVYATIKEQSGRFDRSQTISYAVLRELLGEAMRKGVFWRLKDTAHHLFRKKNAGRRGYEDYGMGEKSLHLLETASPNNSSANVATASSGHHSSQALVENMLDWCIGYAFHECSKLKEDAFQRQHYTTRLMQLKNRGENHTDIIDALMPYTAQTRESIARELERILGVLDNTLQLLIVYLRAHGANAPVALFLATHKERVQQTFQTRWDELMQAMYGGDMCTFYLLAVKASLDGGHKQCALDIAEKAEAQLKDEAAQTFTRHMQAYLKAYKATQDNTILPEN